MFARVAFSSVGAACTVDVHASYPKSGRAAVLGEPCAGAKELHRALADGHNRPAMLVERSCMGVVSNERKVTALAAGALMVLSLSLGGCTTSLMDARAEAPAPPKTSAYPLLADLVPKRENPAMTPDQRLKLQKELSAARDRQAPKSPKSKAKDGATHAEP